MMMNYLFASPLAAIAHAGMVDKAGEDYWSGHLHRVAGRVSENGGDFIEISIAWLHDVCEDTSVTPEILNKAAVPDEVIEGVHHLTRRPGEAYFDYINRIKAVGGRPLNVKIADLEDHLANTTHIPESLVKRYEKALAILEDE